VTRGRNCFPSVKVSDWTGVIRLGAVTSSQSTACPTSVAERLPRSSTVRRPDTTVFGAVAWPVAVPERVAAARATTRAIRMGKGYQGITFFPTLSLLHMRLPLFIIPLALVPMVGAQQPSGGLDVRVSGRVLTNGFYNEGFVNNSDVPTFVLPVSVTDESKGSV